MNTANPNQRIDYLDAVRAFALLLGIVFHASMSFTPIFIGWAVMDVSTSPLIAPFLLVSHSFRMELFFLIAGYFSHLSLRRRGTAAFIQTRVLRVGLPFVLGWFILKPLIVASWIMGNESLRGEVHILNGLKAGAQSLMELPTGLFTGSHLWFLYYLILISSMVLGIRAVTSLVPRFQVWLARSSITAARHLVTGRFSWPVLSLLSASCIWFMDIWGVDTPDKSLIPHWPVSALYTGCFCVGWLLERHPTHLEEFTRITLLRTVICILAIAASIKLSSFQNDLGNPQIGIIRASFCFVYAMMMWALIALSIGLFRHFLSRPNSIVRYVADASYWLYLVHLPIVVWLQIAFAELEFPWIFKLTAICTLTVAISLLLYDLLVRSTFIGQLLNGRKRDRVLFDWRHLKGRDRPKEVLPLSNS